MLKFKIASHFLMLLFLIGFVSAATIHGTIYDLSLKKANNAGVELNTSPRQFLIAQNGTYSFNVPNGDYRIKARLVQKNSLAESAEENITVKQDGSYILDLVLFPNIEEGVEPIDIDVNSNNILGTDEKNNILIGSAILLILGIILSGLYYFKIRKKQVRGFSKTEKGAAEESYEEYSLGQIIKIIKEEGGRTTQKNIRKQIPLSEAKISLMITELEHNGIVEKIKKGRGNIIILKRN